MPQKTANTKRPCRKAPIARDNAFERSQFAQTIRMHRRNHFMPEKPSYAKNRGFLAIKAEYGFDIEGFLRKQIQFAAIKKINAANGQIRTIDSKKPMMRVLNVGSGHLVLEHDIKKAFGSQVFLASLNVVGPRMNTNGREKLFLKELPRIGEKTATERKRIRTNTNNNAKNVDEIIVSSIEAFSSHKKFDLIIDIAAALTHGKNFNLISGVYFNELAKGGLLITNAKATAARTFVNPIAEKISSFVPVSPANSKIIILKKV